jgi:hypothetical protein
MMDLPDLGWGVGNSIGVKHNYRLVRKRQTVRSYFFSFFDARNLSISGNSTDSNFSISLS